MRARLLTSLIALPIIIACTYYGGTSFVILVSIIAMAALNEFFLLMQRAGHAPVFSLGNLFTLGFIIFFNTTLKHPNWEPAASGVLTTAIIVTFIAPLLFPLARSVADLAITLLGCLYIGWLFGYLILIRAFTPHGMYLFFLMVTVWANDTAAYLVGKRWGKMPLSHMSPHKTREGAVAGLMVSVMVAVGLGTFIHMAWWNAACLGATISVVGQMSDLVESMIKRYAHTKDASGLIPGHGGMLDRLDSFIFAAPVAYYYLSWFVL